MCPSCQNSCWYFALLINFKSLRVLYPDIASTKMNVRRYEVIVHKNLLDCIYQYQQTSR